IPPLNITDFVEFFRKSFQRSRRRRTERKHPDPVDLPRVLCLSAMWRREQAQDERDDGPNNAVPHGRLLASVSCRSSSAPVNAANARGEPRPEATAQRSNCLGYQGAWYVFLPWTAWACQGVRGFSIAWSMVKNLCLQAVKATFFPLPAARSRSSKALLRGLSR